MSLRPDQVNSEISRLLRLLSRAEDLVNLRIRQIIEILNLRFDPPNGFPPNQDLVRRIDSMNDTLVRVVQMLRLFRIRFEVFHAIVRRRSRRGIYLYSTHTSLQIIERLLSLIMGFQTVIQNL